MPLVRNLTPFQFMVSAQRYAAPVYDAAAFASVKVSEWPSMDRIYVQQRGGNLEWPVGMVWVTDSEKPVSITVDQLRSNSDPSSAFTRTRTFENCTSEWVDITTARDGASRLDTLAPGEQYINDFPNAEVWIVRSGFSNEVVGAFIDDDDTAHREIKYQITNEYREQLAENAPLPSPLPGNRPVVLISGKRETHPPEDRAYITIEDRDGLAVAEFNGRADVVPRRVKIVAAKLIWDANDDNYGLMSLQGHKVLDLESLEMLADEVIIRSHLRMPGTKVSITARRVAFEYDGMIDTSPPIATPPAFTRPDEAKPPKSYTAKNGPDGLPGGPLTLVAHTLVVGDTGKIRFRTSGGPGGAGEEGGLLAYKRKPSDPAGPYQTVAPETSADCAIIEQSDVSRKLPEWFGTVTTAQLLDGWIWPGRKSEPSKCEVDGQPIGLAKNADPGVTSLLITAHDDRFFSQDTNWFAFPEGDRHQENLVYPSGRYHDRRPVGPRPVPGDGADAYAGGRPGDGGAAGVISTAPQIVDVVAQVSDTTGGKAGPQTAAVDGGEPGKPRVALLVDMVISRNADGAREPQIWAKKYRSLAGKSAEAKNANPGSNGEVQSWGGSWLRVEIIDAVLAFARNAFRDGHRDAAQRAIEPYYVILRSPLLSRNQQYSAPMIAVSAMRENLIANVDYYGNPPGWLPRLRVSTNLSLFDTIRRASYQLLYFATTTEEKFDDLSNRRGLAKEVRSALERETTACRKAIAEATGLLAAARLELAKIANDLGLEQQNLDKLKNYAEQEALSAAEKQRIFKGVMQVVGGAMKAIPVGQPYLGAGGDLVSGVGEIDFFTSGKGADQAAEVLAKIGAATDSFLEDNTDLLSADMTKNLQQKVKLKKKDVRALSDQVTQANGEASQIEANVAEYTSPIADKRLEYMKTRRDELTVSRQQVEDAIQEFQSGEPPDDVEKDAKTVARPKAAKEASLEHDVASLTKELAEVDAKMARLEDEDKKKNAKRLVRLKLQQVALTDAKVRAEAVQKDKAQADAKVEELEVKAAAKQERYAEAMGRLKGMGKGISGIGAGISALATPISKDDEKVQALAVDLLKTKDPQQYQQVMKEMEGLGNRQSAAMEKLTKAQSIINTNVAQMAESLTAQNNLGRQLNNLDGVLDVRAKQYLRGMRQRAEEMFHSSMYHLVMAYRYEALEDLPDSFVNYDRIAAALQKLDRAKPASDSSKQPANLTEAMETLSIDMTKPTEEDLKRIDEQVLNFEFLKLGVDIVRKRQHSAKTEMQLNTLDVPLNPDQLRQLSQLGTITFSLVEDFGYGGDYAWENARIADITLEDLSLTSPDRVVNMRVEFRHSGESIIKSPDGPDYYYFRAAHTDDPISWTFGTTTTIKKKKKDDDEPEVETEIKRDTKADADPFLTRALSDDEIEFQEYWPAFFSQITLDVDPGSKAQVDAITDLTFHVKYAIPKSGTTTTTKRVTTKRTK